MKIFNQHASIQRLVLPAADATLAVASFYLSNLFMPADWLDLVPSQGPVLHFNALLFAVFVLAGQSAMGIFSAQQRESIEALVARTFVGICMAATGLAMLDFVVEFVGSRTEWLGALVLCLLLLCASRVYFFRIFDDEIFRSRVLVYGAGKRASRILELRRASDQRGFRVVAFVCEKSDAERMNDDRVIDPGDRSLLALAQELNATEIVAAVDDRRENFRIAELLECKLAGIRVIDLLGFLERETGRVKVSMVDPSWLVFSEGFQGVGSGQLAFRLLDLFACGLIFVLGAPLMVVIAVLILFVDGSPVLYRQDRVGLNGKNFTLYKFRSMRMDAEAVGEPVWASAGDSRVTRIGRVLRKYRFDELPQLINVIRGDMSLVGPRPERPEFVSDLARTIPYYHERHCVKPGLTGWAQLCYPYGASREAALVKLEFDMYYVKNRSLIFNLIILLRTVEVVLWQKGSR